MTKHFAKPTLCAIARDRVAQSPGRDDSQSIRRTGIGLTEHSHQFRGDTPAALLHCGELMTRTEAGSRRKARRQILSSADGQALAAFGAPALEDDAPILTGHPHEKTVNATAAAAIGLKRTLHLLRLPTGDETPILTHSGLQSKVCTEEALTKAVWRW